MPTTEPFHPSGFQRHAEASREALLHLAQAWIAIPSPACHEGDLAASVLEALTQAGYDEVFQDEIGNVVGRIRGDGTGPSVLFLCPLDHAEPLHAEEWRYPPYAAQLTDEALHGCGASQNKGALAAMLTAGRILKHERGGLRGDVIVAGVVQTQVFAHIGTRVLVDRTLPERGIQFDLCVVGQPTGLNLALGQRGRLEVELTTVGRVCHAGAPWLGSHAILAMQPVLAAVQELASNLPSHPNLDRSTLAVTAIRSAPQAPQLVPDRCTISLDRRYLPSESTDAALWQLQSIVNRIAQEDTAFTADLQVRRLTATSFTGVSQDVACVAHPFLTDASHALIHRVARGLQEVGQNPVQTYWRLPSDAAYVATMKRIVTLGYSPGDEKFAETPFEHVRLDRLIAAVSGYAAIGAAIAG
ncbi:MAG: M20/M25/M40 family metallo-hydrolase [Candidatus Sericytochromatia bacterium]|nr:M20/M25/M40 family metallo-hydrolase [Candidatus Sericytochromatia bacterium]